MKKIFIGISRLVGGIEQDRLYMGVYFMSMCSSKYQKQFFMNNYI